MKLRQNFFLASLILIGISVLSFYLYSSGKLFEKEKSHPDQIQKKNESNSSIKEASPGNHEELSEQEAMGDPIQETQANTATVIKETKEEQHFKEILLSLKNCFNFKQSPAELSSIKLETISNYLSSELGTIVKQNDQWMNWHFKDKAGLEKRLRMENIETADGVIQHELKLYALDKENLPVVLPIDKSKSQNPTNEVINEFLNEGEVFFKERATEIFFPNKAVLSIVEKNEKISDFEFQKDETIFRCDSLENKDFCRCFSKAENSPPL